MLTPKVPNWLAAHLSQIFSLAFCNLLTTSKGSELHQGDSLDPDFPVALVYEVPQQETTERTHYRVTVFIPLVLFPQAQAELTGLLVEGCDCCQNFKQSFYSLSLGTESSANIIGPKHGYKKLLVRSIFLYYTFKNYPSSPLSHIFVLLESCQMQLLALGIALGKNS